MVYDLHNDMLTALPKEEFSACLNAYAGQRVGGIIFAVWTTRLRSVDSALLLSLTSGVKPPFEYGFAIEDLHFLSYAPMSVLSAVPLKYVGLTWNGENALAGGAHTSGGLTALGRRALKEISRLGIALDTAHLSRKSFFEATDGFDGKILCSHTCMDSLTPHVRNLTDEQISVIISRGGIVGIAFESSFLSAGKATMSDAVKHIDGFVQKFGCENLAVGTDFNGCTPPKDLQSYGDLPVLKDRLKRLGYDKTALDKIFEQNAKNFFARAGHNGDKI